MSKQIRLINFDFWGKFWIFIDRFKYLTRDTFNLNIFLVLFIFNAQLIEYKYKRLEVNE